MTDFIWPFHTKSPYQYRRVDEGWDLQGVGSSEEICLAVASGVVHHAHDPGTDGGHFGDPYPFISLDKPVGGFTGVYYGHTHPLVMDGTYVRQGDKVAITTTPGGGGAPGKWLEIGFWNVAAHRPYGWGYGQAMHDYLINAPTWAEGDDEMKNLIILVPESGQGASWIWNTAVDIRYGIADSPTAANLQAAGVPRIVMADEDINEIPHR